MRPKELHLHIFTIVLLLIIASALSYVVYDQHNALVQFREESKEASLQLQEQVVMSSLQLQKSFDEKIHLLENAQVKTIDELTEIKSQFAHEKTTREAELDEIQEQIIASQKSGGDFSAVAKKILKSTVSIRTNIGSGSGIIVGGDGTIVTNYHVIKDAKAAIAVTNDQETHRLTLLGSDQRMDIAVLRMDSDQYDYLSYANSEKVQVGQAVIAAGSPQGLDFSITEGIVSAKRTIEGIHYLQIDVPINPGNSGGPLVNTEGNIVGMNTFKYAESEGLGFAISSNDVAEAVSTILNPPQ